jgi:hypothetical protein
MVPVRIKRQQGWYFTLRLHSASASASKSPTYSTHVKLDSMSSCSKAPRGLFVLLRTDGIFTANALSPSSSLRQYPYHYAIRAGQNLPDKEFRYLRTVIVTAAVHWGFSSHREALPLTFQHRAGVSPYTSTFVLAETCVFGKQLHGFFSCGPVTLSTTIMCAIRGSFLFSILSRIRQLPNKNA